MANFAIQSVAVCMISAASLALAGIPEWTAMKAEATTAAARGDYASAEALLQSAEVILPADDLLNRAVLLNETGAVHHSMWRISEAERDFRLAADTAAKCGAAGASEEAVALANLATIVGYRGNLTQAETLLTQAQTALAKSGESDPRTSALVLTSLALTLQREGRGKEAQSVYDSALAAFESYHGPEDLGFAKILNKIASFEAQIARYPESLRHSERAEHIASNAQSVAGRDEALACDTHGFTLGQLGRYAEAKQLLTRAITLERSAGAPMRTALAESLNHLAVIEEKMGDFETSQQHEQDALDLLDASTNYDPRLRAAIWNNMGVGAAHRNQFREAEQYYRKAGTAWQEIEGPASTTQAATLSNIAALRSRKHDYKRGEELFRKALAIDIERFGKDHVQVALDLTNIAAECFHQKRYEEALDLYGEARQIQEKHFGVENVDVARTRHNMAVVYNSTGRTTDAELTLDAAIHSMIGGLGPDTPELAQWFREYAAVLKSDRQYARAEEAETEAMRVQVKNAIASSAKSQPDGPRS